MDEIRMGYGDAGAGGYVGNFDLYYQGATGPGSGHFWGDGMGYDDWNPTDGSQIYRDMLMLKKAGLSVFEFGGKFSFVDGDGSRFPLVNNNGKIGYNQLFKSWSGIGNEEVSYTLENGEVIKAVKLAEFEMHNIFKHLKAKGTQRHQHDYGSSLSISGNLTLLGGISLELGVAWDNDGDYTFYFDGGPSFGLDASIGFLAKSYEPTDQRRGFDVTDLQGMGSSYNAAILFYDFTWGGDLPVTDHNPWTDFAESYTAWGSGASFGLPAGFTWDYTKTWIFGTKGSK